MFQTECADTLKDDGRWIELKSSVYDKTVYMDQFSLYYMHSFCTVQFKIDPEIFAEGNDCKKISSKI